MSCASNMIQYPEHETASLTARHYLNLLLLMLAAFTLSAVVLLMEMSHKKFQKIKIRF